MKKQIKLQDNLRVKSLATLKKEFKFEANCIVTPDGSSFHIGLCKHMCGKEQRITAVGDELVMVKDDPYHLFYSPHIFEREDVELKVLKECNDFYDLMDHIYNEVGLQSIVSAYEEATGNIIDTDVQDGFATISAPQSGS